MLPHVFEALCEPPEPFSVQGVRGCDRTTVGGAEIGVVVTQVTCTSVLLPHLIRVLRIARSHAVVVHALFSANKVDRTDD